MISDAKAIVLAIRELTIAVYWLAEKTQQSFFSAQFFDEAPTGPEAPDDEDVRQYAMFEFEEAGDGSLNEWIEAQ